MFTTSLTLLDRLRDPQDDAAWQQFDTLYTPLLHFWLRPHCRQEADVDDLTQDILTVLTQKVKDFAHNSRMGAFRTWLRAIATNKLGDYLPAHPAGAARVGQGQARLLEQLADPASDLSQGWDRQHAQHVAAVLLARLRRSSPPPPGRRSSASSSKGNRPPRSPPPCTSRATPS